MKLNIASLAGLVMVGVAAGYASAPAHGAETAAAAAKSTYSEGTRRLRNRQDRAGPRHMPQGSRRGRAGTKRNTLDNSGSTRQNAIERCNLVPAEGQGRLPGADRGAEPAEPVDEDLGKRRRRRHHPRDDDHHDRRAGRHRPGDAGGSAPR